MGTNPKGASPAKRRSERLNAGRTDVTNSLHGEDHSTSSLGASSTSTGSSSWRVSITRAVLYHSFRGLFQFYRRVRYLFQPQCDTAVPAQMSRASGSGQRARAATRAESQ